MVDKVLAIIIIFIGMMILMAAILAMGAIPKIFQNSEVIQETKNETSNQTELIIKQFQRENNTTQKILQNQNTSLANQAVLLEQNHDDIILNRNLSQDIQNITNSILLISKEHKQVAKDHDELSNIIRNITENIDKSLFEYGENSVKQFQQILDNQKALNQTLQQILNKIK